MIYGISILVIISARQRGIVGLHNVLYVNVKGILCFNNSRMQGDDKTYVSPDHPQ